MDKRNENRHNFFTEMAVSREGFSTGQVTLLLLWGPDISTSLATVHPRSWGAVSSETNHSSGWTPASVELQLHQNA